MKAKPRIITRELLYQTLTNLFLIRTLFSARIRTAPTYEYIYVLLGPYVNMYVNTFKVKLVLWRTYILEKTSHVRRDEQHLGAQAVLLWCFHLLFPAVQQFYPLFQLPLILKKCKYLISRWTIVWNPDTELLKIWPNVSKAPKFK